MNHATRFTFYVSRFHLFVLIAYLGLTVVLTYPLILNFADHIPGSPTWGMDEFTFVWNFWWFKHAVFDLGVNPLHTNHIFYPIGVDLILYTFTLLNAVLAIPIEFVFGLPAASNTLLLFAFVASAYGTFLLTRYLLRAFFKDEREARWITFAAFVAGAVFAFTSSRFVYASLGHYNFVSSQFVPFYALFLIKTTRAAPMRNAVLAGLFGALAILVDSTYAVFLVLFTLIYFAFVWHEKNAVPGLWKRLSVLVGVTFVFASPLLVPSFIAMATAGYTLPGWGHAEKLLVDLFGFVTPTSLHPLNRNWTQELDAVRQGLSRFVDINTVFLGNATLALAALGAWVFRKQLGMWIVSAIAFAILSLGPLLHINGQSTFDLDGLSVTFPMPFLLLHYIPFLKENRVPNRFSILITLALAILVAFAIMWLLSKVGSWQSAVGRKLILPTAYGLLFTALLLEHLAVPLPLSDARVPEVYHQIAQEPGDFAILSLPLGWRNSFGTLGAEDTRTQFYQSVHQKRLLSGNTSRNAPFLFEYFDRISLFHSLTQIEMGQPVSEETLAHDKASAPALMAFFDVRYVVINAAIPGRLPYADTRDAVLDYVRAVLPLSEKIYDRDGVVAYRVNQATLSSRQQIAFGTDAAQLYQAEGWDRDEMIGGANANWANRQTARIVFPIREVADYQITLRALPFTYPNAPAQTMELMINDQAIQRFELRAGWEEYSAVIPARTLRVGINDLVLRFGYAVRPRDVLPANYAIGATGVTSPVDIVVNSGAFGSVKVNGREVSKQGRGYNIVVIDPQNDNVIASRFFNTADDRAQSRAMTDFLAQVRQGQIVVVAAQEDAGTNLGDRTVAMLQTIGAQVDLRRTPTYAHAIIGVKGAPPGTAIEQSSDGDVFISVGRNADERTLSAAVSTIVIERK